MNALFQVHMLNEQGKNKARAIASAFDRLVDTLLTCCPEGREFSIVKTKLEEACFYAKKAMANDGSNQELP